MRKSKFRNFTYTIAIITVIATMVTGCNSNKSDKQDLTNNTQDKKQDLTDNQHNSTNKNQVETKTSTSLPNSEIVIDKEFTEEDLNFKYDDHTATHITFDGINIKVSGDGATAKNGVLTISKGGTYVFTGTLSDGQVVVNANDPDKVHLVLKGVSITCSNNTPIYVKNADKTFITLVEKTENSLTNGVKHVKTGDKKVDGVIFSTADLTLNGNGILNIKTKDKHGIVSKEDLVITGGSYNITAVKDALYGKDCVKIKDGIFNISTVDGNGIQSKNDDDITKGYIYICGGDITVTNSDEGIEGTVIMIEDGTIHLTTKDDGLNSESGDSRRYDDDANEPDSNCYISISGGTITVDAQGDGIDTNGYLYISGGTIYVSGPTDKKESGLNYKGTADITGGTIVVTGSLGMEQGFSASSTQYSIFHKFTTVCKAGTEVKLTDSSGKIVVSYTPNKDYQSVVISTPALTKDTTYTLTCGDQIATITLPQ